MNKNKKISIKTELINKVIFIHNLFSKNPPIGTDNDKENDISGDIKTPYCISMDIFL